MRRNKRIIGRYIITTHCINRYKERVDDDPALKRGRRKHRDIERIIRGCLNEVKDTSELPIINDYHILKTKFTSCGKDYYILFKNNTAVTLLTEEQYNNTYH